MSTNDTNIENQDEFIKVFRGSFIGILRWPQLDEFWQVLKSRADDNWFIYAIGEPPPDKATSKDMLIKFIDEIDVLLRKEHQENYCGVVYVDNKTEPHLIKIFDPNNLGVSCGYSNSPPLPGWIISRLKPVDLLANLPQTQARKRWWQKIFGA